MQWQVSESTHHPEKTRWRKNGSRRLWFVVTAMTHFSYCVSWWEELGLLSIKI